MSIKGSSIRWLEAAIKRGDLLTAWTVAFELPRLPLDHALALVVLTATDHEHPARFDATARRWSSLYLTDAAALDHLTPRDLGAMPATVPRRRR